MVLLPRQHLQCRSSRSLGDSFRTSPLWVVEVAEEVCPVVDRRRPTFPQPVAEVVWVAAPVAVEGLASGEQQMLSDLEQQTL